jgi:hypothetical protein
LIVENGGEIQSAGGPAHSKTQSGIGFQPMITRDIDKMSMPLNRAAPMRQLLECGPAIAGPLFEL